MYTNIYAHLFTQNSRLLVSSSSKLVAMLLEISINLLTKTFDVIINPAYPLKLLQCAKNKSISPEQSLKELRNYILCILYKGIYIKRRIHH